MTDLREWCSEALQCADLAHLSFPCGISCSTQCSLLFESDSAQMVKAQSSGLEKTKNQIKTSGHSAADILCLGNTIASYFTSTRLSSETEE